VRQKKNVWTQWKWIIPWQQAWWHKGADSCGKKFPELKWLQVSCVHALLVVFSHQKKKEKVACSAYVPANAIAKEQIKQGSKIYVAIWPWQDKHTGRTSCDQDSKTWRSGKAWRGFNMVRSDPGEDVKDSHATSSIL